MNLNDSAPACPNSLTEEQIEQFQNDGYLAFSEVLTADEVVAARRALREITANLSSSPEVEYVAPKPGKSNHSGATFRRKETGSMLQLEAGFDPIGQPLEEIDQKVRKYMWFCREDPVFRRMVSPGSRLHGVVETLLGKAPILFQEMALVKPAFVGSEKPWHQDNAYFSVEPLNAILGVWLALDDATVENGCMHVIPGAHLKGGVKHHHGTDCEIAAEKLAVDRAIAVPVPAGGALFFYGMLPHQTPPNASPSRRRALQFHYRGAHTQVIDPEVYDRLFVDHRSGSPASCRAASRLGF